MNVAGAGAILPVCGIVHPARRPLSHAVRRRSFTGKHQRVLHRRSGQGELHAIGQTYVFERRSWRRRASCASWTHLRGARGSSESPPLPGNVSLDAEIRAAAAHDFGRLIHRQPRGVLKPTSGADIASLMRWAKGQGVKVAARGQGHSIYGRAIPRMALWPI